MIKYVGDVAKLKQLRFWKVNGIVENVSRKRQWRRQTSMPKDSKFNPAWESDPDPTGT